MRNSIFIVVILLTNSIFSVAPAFSADETAKQGRGIRVGVYQNKPKVFIDESGQATGLFIDVLAEMAKEEGWELIYVPCQWAECLTALKEGRIDLMPDVAYSHKRDKRFDFHRLPVAESWSRLYSRRHLPIRSMSELNGKRVALLQGSIQQTEFALMMRGFGLEVTMVPTESYKESFRLVQSGKVDVAVSNHFFGDYFYREYGLIKTPIVFQMAQLFYATTEGRNAELLQVIDRYLDAWRKAPNSAYYLALAHWMEKPPRHFVPEYIIWIIGIIVGLLALSGTMISLLRWEVRKRTMHLEQRTAELKDSLLGTIAAMSLTVEKRDPYTAGHQIRVAKLAKAMAERLGLSEEKVEGIYLAGVIHDIGKFSVPIEILAKRDALSAEDRSIIRQHSQSGYDILKPIKFPWPIAKIVYQHHERMDGSGYPQGLAGDEILMGAKILAVADVVESITLHRPYRKSLGIKAALKEIAKNKGMLYDMRVVDACEQILKDGEKDIFE